MDKNKFFKKNGHCPSEEQRLLTTPFYRNSNVIYARFDDWKGIDRFYFIPLYLEMTYAAGGITAELAPDPVWLGSFVQNTLNHPELYRYKCPKCGKTVLPYRYAGSPLSGRVDLEGYCECGWKGYEMVHGWFECGEALREQLAADKFRHTKYKLLQPNAEPATIDELSAWLTR